jgi:small conductance mechanosensitive channel
VLPTSAADGHLVVGTTAGAPAGTGWLYDLLVKVGVSASAAHTVAEFVVRPGELLLVLLVALLVATLGAKAIRRYLGRLAGHAAGRSSSPRAASRAATVSALAANLWRFIVALVAIAIALGILGINLTPLLASATVIGATIGFGAQALVRDYLSGALLTLEDQFGIGDTIVVNDTTGVVEDLSLRVTRIRAYDGTVWYVPNGDIRRLGNGSRGWVKAIVDLVVALPPGTTVDAVRATVLQAATDVAQRPRFRTSCPDQPEVVGVIAAVATSLTIRVTVRTEPFQRDPLERAIREVAVERLGALGVWPAPGA